jgi:hypothetical protein
MCLSSQLYADRGVEGGSKRLRDLACLDDCLVDLLPHVIREQRHDRSRLHVLGGLFRPRRAHDDRADMGILEARCDAHTRQSRANFLRDPVQLADRRQKSLTLLTLQPRLQPFVARQIGARILIVSLHIGLAADLRKILVN